MGRAKAVRAYLLPVGLILLLGLLASLQYRWTGQISAAERERMQASLRSSTFRFSRDVTEELVAVFRTFHLESARNLEASLSSRLARWRTESAFPDLVDRIYVFRPREGERDLFELKDEDLRPTSWPDALSKWHDEPWPEEGDRDRAWRRPLPPTFSDDPLLLGIPIGSPREAWTGTAQPSRVLVLLHEGVLREYLFPQLEARYFGSEFDVVVTRRDGNVFFASAEAEASAVEARADIEVPLLSRRGFFGEGPPEERRPALPRAGSPERRPVPGRSRPPFGGAQRDSVDGGWHLYVRHRAGSLDAAVTTARYRNLAVSFAVMGLLAASVVLVSVSARRATELSERKMEFVAGVSHELRTPVAVIRSAGQNLADGSVSDPSRVAHYGRVIEAEGRRLEDLLEQVLELAGIQSLKRRYRSDAVSVREIVSRAISDCQSLAREEQPEVTVQSSAEDLQVRGDREALRRAVSNLLGNAIKHTGDVNGVEVHVSRRPEHRIAIRVSDHGPGIPSQEREHLFEPFYRGSRAQERQVPGSGLGLSLVDHIVRAHGGTIEVESSPGEGASFTLVLPEAEGPA